MKTKDPCVKGIDAAIKRAAQRARDVAERTGTPLYACQNGRVVNLLAPKKAKVGR